LKELTYQPTLVVLHFLYSLKKKNFGKNKFSILVVIDWNILIRKINIFFPALKYIIEKAISNAFSH